MQVRKGPIRLYALSYQLGATCKTVIPLHLITVGSTHRLLPGLFPVLRIIGDAKFDEILGDHQSACDFRFEGDQFIEI